MNIKELNNKYNSINLGDFYSKDYADYAIYRALQRIPNVLDGFAQTQRKSIYTCIAKKVEKKINVADLSSLVKTFTKYHHGMNSIEIAITNLVPAYNNQLPLLKEDGSYGCRSEREASASRYIETRLHDYTKVLFNEIDNKEFITEQSTEGFKIEPLTMIPLLPLVLINGQQQIGVGYACSILPRDINQIIKVMEDILKGKRKNVPSDIPVKIPKFNGLVEKHGDQWQFVGKIEIINKTTVHITEVPPKFTRVTFLNILDKLKNNEKIRSYSENILGDSFDITVKFPNGTDLNDIDLIAFFNLRERKTENITLVNAKNEIVRYNNSAEVLYEYIVTVLGIIKKRKEFILTDLKDKALKNQEKIRFIRAVNNEDIILKNKKSSDVEIQLDNLQFQKFEESYNYLLNMKISSLTEDKIDDLLKIIKEDEDEIIELENTTAAQLWLQDISKIKNHIKKSKL